MGQASRLPGCRTGYDAPQHGGELERAGGLGLVAPCSFQCPEDVFALHLFQSHTQFQAHAARRAAAGANTSRPWKVGATCAGRKACEPMAYAATSPSSTASAGPNRPLSGPMNRHCGVSTTSGRRGPPTPGSTTATTTDPAELQHSLANLKLERDAVLLYEGLAAIEKDPIRADAFHAIASGERRHAFVWASRVEAAGAEVPRMANISIEYCAQ